MDSAMQYFRFKNRDREICVINFNNIRKASFILRAITHSGRQEILTLLASGRCKTVSDLAAELSIEQSVLSQQMAVLKRAELVLTSRSGKYIFYSLNTKHLSAICRHVEKINTSLPEIQAEIKPGRDTVPEVE